MRLPKTEGYRIDEEIYRGCLESISNCENYGIVGGSGVSLNIYPKCGIEATRKTDDIDISIYPQITNSELFYQEGNSIQRYLSDRGYDTKVSKPSANYEIEVVKKIPDSFPINAVGNSFPFLFKDTVSSDRHNKQPFFIHFSRRSKKYLDLFGDRIKREVENAYEIRVPDAECSVMVIRPEDLILPKLMRKKQRDIYDIALLIRYTEIDKNYLEEHAGEWYHEEKLTEDMLNIFEGLYNKYKL